MVGRLRRDAFRVGVSPLAPDWIALRDRAWRDVDSYLEFLKAVESQFAGDTEFVAFLDQVCNPRGWQPHLDIQGQIARFMEYLAASRTRGVRLLASEPILAQGLWARSDLRAPRLTDEDRGMVFQTLQAEHDEGVVADLADSLTPYLRDDSTLARWFLENLVVATWSSDLRAELASDYLTSASPDANSIDAIARTLGGLDAPGRCQVLGAFTLVGSDGAILRLALEAIEHVAQTDPDAQCRGEAYAALFKADDAGIFSRTLGLATKDASTDARAAAVMSLGGFGEYPATQMDRFSAGLTFLSDQSQRVQRLALDALYAMIKSDVRRQDLGGATARSRQVLTQIRDTRDETARRLLKDRLLTKLRGDWPEALQDPDVQAQLDAIR